MNDESRYVLWTRDGDQASLRELYNRHRETIFRIAFRYTRSRQDAEDILQETFVRAFKALPSFDLERGTGFAAWIGRIGLHQTLELLRKRKRERRELIIPLSGSNIDPPRVSLLLAGKSRRDRPNSERSRPRSRASSRSPRSLEPAGF